MLDTNIVSYYIKGRPVVLRRVQAVLMSSLCMSVITQAELLYGLAKNPRQLSFMSLSQSSSTVLKFALGIKCSLLLW